MKLNLKVILSFLLVLTFLFALGCEEGKGCLIINGNDSANSGQSDSSGFLTDKDENVYNVEFNVVQGPSQSVPPTTGEDLKTVLKRIRKSVVNIHVSASDKISSVGSGVVVATAELSSPDQTENPLPEEEKAYKSFIVTCHHIIKEVSNDDEVIVSTIDGESHYASLIGSDPESDVCVLSVEALLSPVEFLADSDSLEVGEDVIAIGNPLGGAGVSGGTVTKGIISATGPIKVNGVQMSLLQTDAIVGKGSSGGGLFTASGYLVGIVDGSVAEALADSISGLGFAIPSNLTRTVSKDLIEYGYVPGKYLLGCNVANKYTDVWGAKSYVHISSLTSDGCFARAGMMVNDRLETVYYTYGDTSTERHTITNADDFIDYIASLNVQVGGVLNFQIKRGTTTIYKSVPILQYIYGES